MSVVELADTARPLLIEGATASTLEPVPPAHELLNVLNADEAGDQPTHPVLRSAQELAATLRERQLTGGAESDRARIVRAIDLWTERNVPQHRDGALLHTETLGEVIAKIVAAYHVMNQSPRPAPQAPVDPTLKDAMRKLTVLCSGYTHLVADITTGKRRLPHPAPAGGYR